VSDTPSVPEPELMSAIRARNLSRHYKGLADNLRQDGYRREADIAERDALWWMTYALSLSQTPPGAVDEHD
jgi:hypothetical protein